MTRGGLDDKECRGQDHTSRLFVLVSMIRLLLLLLFALPAMAIEKPDYTVAENLGEVEVRNYAPMIVAQTTVSGDFNGVGNQAFRRLAGYIFGDNEKAQKISMTAPVAQAPAGENSYIVTFMMPSEHDMDSLPAPDSRDVQLVQQPARTMAALPYRGGWSEEKYRDHETALIKAVEASGRWEIAGQPIWARYDPPMMPWFLRTNEVLIPVTRLPETSNPQ